MIGPLGWSGVNVSVWLVWVLRGGWPAQPVGMAQPARRRKRAQTPPEPEAGSPARHAGGPNCNAVASFRSRFEPPAVGMAARAGRTRGGSPGYPAAWSRA